MTESADMTGLAVLQAGIIGHSVAAAGYLLVALLAVWWRGRTLMGLLLAAASLTTCLWAGATAYALHHGSDPLALSELLGIARSCGWMVVVLGLMYWIPPAQRAAWALAVGGIGVAIAAMTLVFDGRQLGHGDVQDMAVIGAHLALGLLGIAFIENLFRNSPPERYWFIKYLCLGAGALFAYDFFLYSDALLFRHIDVDVYLARGVTSAIVAPLIGIYAARDRGIGPHLAISRRFAFHSATLIGAGLYLMIMAAAGYYVRQFGGTWSTFAQAVFFFGALVLLLVPILSGSVRAYLRVIVEKSLFAYKYDYRAEWLRFIKTISSADTGATVPARVIEAVCNILESPEGALWLQNQPDRYSLAARWNASRWHLSEAEHWISAASPLLQFLQRTQWVIDLAELGEGPGRYEGLGEIPPWVAALSRAWLIIPLVHDEQIFGIMMLGRPRAARVLTWEDFDILKTVGRQAASYLALQQMHEQLNEARQFEDFNKRFAFVVHDIKNLASQLSLVMSNAARHRDNADFQRDALETVKQSVEKLNRLLRQIHKQPARAEPKSAVALAPLLRDIVEARCRTRANISLHLQASGAAVEADYERLKTVVDHLVQNAVEAVGERGKVEVRLTGAGTTAVVEVEDDGPGMEPAFVRDQLFRPFATTKGAGYGIGAYESREYARSLGGNLDVVTAPGRGTIMRMSLPNVADTRPLPSTLRAPQGAETRS